MVMISRGLSECKQYIDVIAFVLFLVTQSQKKESPLPLKITIIFESEANK